MLTTLAATVRVLSEKLAQLEAGNACPGDWVRLDAAVTRAALIARHQFGDSSDDDVDCDELGELVDELRYIKLCAEAHRFGLSADGDDEHL
jgi:hypothetical protein